MAEIILIQPRAGSWDEMSVRFPESLLAIAALPVAKGHDVRIIDQRVSKRFDSELNEAVGPETKIFGLTAITGEQISHALQVTTYLKKRYPHIPICWGGVHATLVPEQTTAHPLIDFVVPGDGDLVFCELYERLREGQSLDGLPVLFKKSQSEHDRIINPNLSPTNCAANFVRDLDALPRLPYHLIDFEKYNVFHTKDELKSATLNTSRGCYYRCKFCSTPVINHGKWRGYSARRVLENVENLYKNHGIRLIYFQDDYFPGPKKRFIEILRGLARYKRNLMWSTLGIRADILSKLSDKECDLLFDSGCHSLEIGIESGNERIIKHINKGETLEQMSEANIKLAKYNIKIKYTLIIGFPGESEEETKDTVRFAAELENANSHAYCLIFTFLPIIGTPFYDEASQHGFVTPKSLEEWANMNFDGWMKKYTANWVSPALIRKLEAISFVSYFHNRNVQYKFGGSALLRFCFRLYHPVARWRFKHNYFDNCFEVVLKDWLLSAKQALRR